MIRLVGAELNRLLSRRFTIMAMIAVFAAVLAFQLLVNSELSPPSGAELAAGQSQFDADHQQWQQTHEQVEKECAAEGAPIEECAEPEPQLSNYQHVVEFADIAHASVSVAVYLAALMVFMVAGSFIGAEFGSGSISNWLTFIPQRGRVFAAKLIAITAVGAVLGFAAIGLALLIPIVLAKIYGTPLTGLAGLVGVGARGIGISVALAAVGFCIGLVSRHTAAAIGVLLGYLFVWFVRTLVLGSVATAQKLTAWAPEANLAAIVEKKHVYSVPVPQITSQGYDLDFVEHTISLTHGLVYWAVLLALVIGGSLLVFRRRDVT